MREMFKCKKRAGAIAASQIQPNGQAYCKNFVATSDDEFGRWYAKSWKNLLVAHGVAAILTWLLYCAWQENRPSVA